MAKYRLLQAHELESQDGTQRAWLEGDQETLTRGDLLGAIVGDGTPYRVRWPTLFMHPLDKAAEAMIEKEKERLEINQATMNPIDALPINPDEYERRYIPGLEGITRHPAKPDGAPVGKAKAKPPLRLVTQAPVPDPEPPPPPEPPEPEEPDEPEDSPQPTPAAASPPAVSPPPPWAEPGSEKLPDYVPPPRAAPFGKPEFGYRYDGSRKVPEPRQQASLAEIRRMKDAHYPVRAMAIRLKQLNLPCPEGSTIRKILQRQTLSP